MAAFANRFKLSVKPPEPEDESVDSVLANAEVDADGFRKVYLGGKLLRVKAGDAVEYSGQSQQSSGSGYRGGRGGGRGGRNNSGNQRNQPRSNSADRANDNGYRRGRQNQQPNRERDNSYDRVSAINQKLDDLAQKKYSKNFNELSSVQANVVLGVVTSNQIQPNLKAVAAEAQETGDSNKLAFGGQAKGADTDASASTNKPNPQKKGKRSPSADASLPTQAPQKKSGNDSTAPPVTYSEKILKHPVPKPADYKDLADPVKRVLRHRIHRYLKAEKVPAETKKILAYMKSIGMKTESEDRKSVV